MTLEGHFTSPLFIVWYLKDGSVLVRNQSQTIRASTGDWMVCLPGTHFHRFSESAQIVSLQWIVDCTDTPVMWRGSEVLRLPPDQKLTRLLRSLRQIQGKIGLNRHYAAGAHGPPLPLPQQLQWQTAILNLFEMLLNRLASEGVWLEACRGHGVHTRRSLSWFLGCDLSKPFSREEIARHCNLSPSQLDRVWRKEIGITPRQYWNRLRLRQACEWLRNDTRSIKEITVLLGFEHASHFSTWFRQLIKRSARDYRTSPAAP